MIKILYRNQIDLVIWDSFIERSIQRNPYALSWFLDLMPKAWGAVIEFDNTLNYVAVLPFQIRTKYGIKIIHQEPGTNELGIFSLNENISAELITVLKKEFKYISRYYFNVKNDLSNLFGYEHKITYHLSLARTYTEIQSNYNQNKKRNLKNAKTKNQSVVESDTIDSLINIFKQNVAHKIYGLKSYQYELLKKIFYETKTKGMSFVLHVRSDDGEVLSAGFFIKYFDRLIYFFGASTNLGKKNGSQTLLLDHVIRKFSESSLVLDLEGGSVDGIDYFYSGFGAYPLKIYSLNQKRMPQAIRSILIVRAKIIKTVIQFCKKNMKYFRGVRI